MKPVKKNHLVYLLKMQMRLGVVVCVFYNPSTWENEAKPKTKKHCQDRVSDLMGQNLYCGAQNLHSASFTSDSI
jgi:hypothetical protein